MKNEKGFGIVAALLVALAIAAVVTTGYLVLRTNSKPSSSTATPTASSTGTSSSTGANATPSTDVEAQSWKRVTSGKGGFTVNIPDGWSVFNYMGGDNIRANEITHAKGAPGSVQNIQGVYAGDSAVRFSVYQSDAAGMDESWGDLKVSEAVPFMLGGIEGKREQVKVPSTWEGCCTYPNTEAYRYTFKVSGKLTVVDYNIYAYDAAKGTNNFNGITASDTYQLEIIDRVVKTLVIK